LDTHCLSLSILPHIYPTSLIPYDFPLVLVTTYTKYIFLSLSDAFTVSTASQPLNSLRTPPCCGALSSQQLNRRLHCCHGQSCQACAPPWVRFLHWHCTKGCSAYCCCRLGVECDVNSCETLWLCVKRTECICTVCAREEKKKEQTIVVRSLCTRGQECSLDPHVNAGSLTLRT